MAIEIQAHLTKQAVKKRWRESRDAVERGHWHMLWLAMSQPEIRNMSELSRRVGMEASWVRRLLLRYNEQGPQGLVDRRRSNRSERLLSADDLRDLEKEIQKNPPLGGGLWNGPHVAHWISRRLKRPVSAQVGWLYLKRLSMSLQVPRPRHHQSASDQEKKAYKKTRTRTEKAPQKAP